VLASLLVSVLLVGIKLTAPKELVQTIERRKELKVNLSLLQRSLEEEEMTSWLADVTHDTALRQETTDAIEPASDQVYTTAEGALIDSGTAIFADYDASSAPVTKMKCSAIMARSETKLDAAGRLLLGRAEVEIPASPQEIVAYILNYDGRHIGKNDPTFDIRSEMVARVNAHHTIVFNRKKLGSGLSDRTFLNSLIAKKVSENPTTYLMVVVPIPQHTKITPKDEAGAVRAENFRIFRFAEVAPGRSKTDFVCSLDLHGLVPRRVTNMIAIPQQEFVFVLSPSPNLRRLLNAGCVTDACARDVHAVLPAVAAAEQERSPRRSGCGKPADRSCREQTEGSGARHPNVCEPYGHAARVRLSHGRVPRGLNVCPRLKRP
jgi:hypothetical protein